VSANQRISSNYRGNQLNLRNIGVSISLVGWFLFCAGAPVSIAASQTGLGIFLGFRLLTAPKQNFARLLRWLLFWIWIIYLVTQGIAIFHGGSPMQNIRDVFEDEWFSLALPVLFLNPLRSKDLRRGWAVFVAVAVVMGFYGIYQHFSGWDPIHHVKIAAMGKYHRAEGTVSFYLTYGAIQLLAMVVALSRASMLKISKRSQWLWYSATGILFLSVLATYGRSLWLGIIPVAVWWFFTLNIRSKSVIAAIAVIALIGTSLMIPELPKRVESIGNSYVNQTRNQLFQTAWRMIEVEPVLGHGIGGFYRDFDQYAGDYKYETRCHPHNDSLLVWVQSGIIGLMAFWMMWVVYFRNQWKGFKKLRRNPDSEAHWIIQAGTWGTIAMLIAGFFQCYYIDAEVASIFWMLIATSASLSANLNIDNKLFIT
jgi:hypothetical protein